MGFKTDFGVRASDEGRKFALTLTLTTETPINRALQPYCEGVRVKEKKLFLLYRGMDMLFYLPFTWHLKLRRNSDYQRDYKVTSRKWRYKVTHYRNLVTGGTTPFYFAQKSSLNSCLSYV